MQHQTITLAAWLHDLSPFLVRFGGDFGIRWYGLAYAAGFAIAWWLLGVFARRGLTLIPPHRVTDVVLALVVGAVLGGRLGYVFFYDLPLIWTFTSDVPWWGVLMVNRGGMASHGGLIGVILACVYISRRLLPPVAPVPITPGSPAPAPRRISILHILDVMALLTPFGLFLGRLANFVNGELLGNIYAPPGAPAPWWTVRFPQERLDAGLAPELTPEQSVRLEALVERSRLPSESAKDAYRFMVEKIQHGDKQLAQELAPLISARYPSQLFQALAEGIVLAALLWLIARSPRRPGVIGAWFMIGYGALRIVTEFWRLPDAHLSVQRIAGLSRGQLLSLGMVLVGAVALPILWKRGAEPVGGWGPRGKKYVVVPVPSPGGG